MPAWSRRSIFVAGAAVAACGRAHASLSDSPAPARYRGVLIRTPDLARSLAFYAGTIGFPARPFETGVALGSDQALYLLPHDGELRAPEADEARTAIAFKTRDMAAQTDRLKRAGVSFLNAEPIPVAVGLSIRFRDPFGNIHALLQPSASEPFAEPAIYNTGFKVSDASTAAFRRLLGEGLGFVARSERYYPPSIPWGHSDGAFAFMLHENEPTEPEIRARRNGGGEAVTLIFSAPAMEQVRSRLLAIGAGDSLVDVGVNRAVLRMPDGLTAQVWAGDPVLPG